MTRESLDRLLEWVSTHVRGCSMVKATVDSFLAKAEASGKIVTSSFIAQLITSLISLMNVWGSNSSIVQELEAILQSLLPLLG